MSLFRLGTIEITPAASATLATVHADPATYLARHQQGDWGEVDEVTRQDNALAVEYHQPICSTYRLSDGTDLLVIGSLIIVICGKLGQICTDFEATLRKSARNIGIDH